MIIEYTLDEMVQSLKKHFENKQYTVEKYSDEFLPARVPLYCRKIVDDNKTIEAVIDITTAYVITKDLFFPQKKIGKLKYEASSVRFFQNYFINANIYLAYPDYAIQNDKFDDFVNNCKIRNIGLLKVSDKKIETIIKPRPLFDTICDNLNISDIDSKMKLEYHLRDFLTYFVYYPEPIFKKRAITGRTKENISFVLIDKLCDLKNISYKVPLKEIAKNFRDESRDDYVIAEKTITNLWEKCLGLEYPNIQRKVENILQRDDEYREHFVHQFQVFLIGAIIIDKIGSKFADKYEEQTGCKIENVWLAASTFHDFSYGLQNFDTWLMEFFQDSLRIKNNQTKENLHLLNLDAAMIRESLYEKITQIVDQLSENLGNYDKLTIIRFFYEKAVRDRNHGVLSAISFLKLSDEIESQKRKINDKGLLEAAVAISCHDEDIWEALCGCHGYRRSDLSLPPNRKECAIECNRELWPAKKGKIFEEKLSKKIHSDNIKCEEWERNLMKEELLKNIKFEDYPIIFLLIFCDSVQDDGRNTGADTNNPDDRSTLYDIDFESIRSKTVTTVKLRASNPYPKEKEIERVKLCLLDNRFRISINDKIIKFNRE